MRFTLIRAKFLGVYVCVSFLFSFFFFKEKIEVTSWTYFGSNNYSTSMWLSTQVSYL